jgi:phosphoribosylanthranilate isomerase
MKIKVCGMRDKENLSRLLELGIDFVGFIFYEKSKRYAREVPNIDFPDSVKKAGVFVNADVEFLIKKAIDNKLDIIQLHGDESPEYCKRLKQSLEKVAHTVAIIKAFAVDEEFDFDVSSAFTDDCDYFLFDTKGKYYGGNSLKFNWTLLKKYNGQTPYFLSGGIGPESKNEIEDFLKSPESSKCVAIDLNSKFEDVPGMKNIEKLKKFKEAMQ